MLTLLSRDETSRKGVRLGELDTISTLDTTAFSLSPSTSSSSLIVSTVLTGTSNCCA